MPSSVSPYQTALELKRPVPGWVPGADDKQRVTVYHTYEDIFNNVKQAFAVVLRDADGEEKSRRYVPVARTIIEATNRYLAKNPELVSVIPPDVTMSPEDQALLMSTLEAFWTREEVPSKLLSMKRWFLVRGDSILHISADPAKEEGSRISLSELEPDHYFPIHDNIDPTRIIGAYAVTIVLADDGTTQIAQRIEYRKVRTPEDSAAFNGTPIGSIFYRIGFFEPDAWDDRPPQFKAEDLTPVAVPAWAAPANGAADYIAGYALPADIKTIPLYHFRNNRTGNEPFGRSELQGIETLMAGVTQTATDSDLSMALTALGVYTTTSGSPKDAQGNDTDWVISPAAVLELERDSQFNRVQGITDLKPLLQHSDQLSAMARETTATPDIAVGRVDVQVAESGVALSIEMAPVIAKNEEKEEELGGKMNQLLFDLINGWFPAYEGTNFNGLVIKMVFGNPLPINEDAIVKNIVALLTAKAIPVEFAISLLKDKLGWDVDPAALAQQAIAEQSAALDAAAARIDAAATAPNAPAA
jgi:hypothetical protein